MTKLVALSMLAFALSAGTFSQAMAWTRSGSSAGPRGTSTFNGSGSCANGSCTSSATRTLPGGYTVMRQSNGSCAGGSCTGTSQVTGPMGAVRTRTGSIAR